MERVLRGGNNYIVAERTAYVNAGIAVDSVYKGARASSDPHTRAFRAGVLTAELQPPTHIHTHLGQPDTLMDTTVSLSCVAVHRIAQGASVTIALSSETRAATLESALQRACDVTAERFTDILLCPTANTEICINRIK